MITAHPMQSSTVESHATLVRDLTEMRQRRCQALLLCRWRYQGQFLLSVRVDQHVSDSLITEHLLQLTGSSPLDDRALTCSIEAAAVWRVGTTTAAQVHDAATDLSQAGHLTKELKVSAVTLLVGETCGVVSCRWLTHYLREL